jgi:hypothetical protein
MVDLQAKFENLDQICVYKLVLYEYNPVDFIAEISILVQNLDAVEM